LEDRRFDEREFVQEVVSHTNVEPHYTFPNSSGLLQDLSDLIYYQEEPFGSTSIYAQYCVMRKAKEVGIKVLLDGQGADELFARYHGYYFAFLTNLLKLGRLRDFMSEIVRISKITGLSIFYILLHVNRETFRALPYSLRTLLYTKVKEGLKYVRKDFFHTFKDREKTWIDDRKWGDLNHRLLADITRYSLRGLLKYEDRNSMAFSIETRVPFADDHRLIEFVSHCPFTYKIHNGWTKYLLRCATEDILPPKVRWRRDKKGFVTSENLWLYEIREELKKLIFSRRCDYINDEALYRDFDFILESHRDKEGVSKIWRVINLKLWLQRFF